MTIVTVSRVARAGVGTIRVGIDGFALQAMIKMQVDIEQTTFGNLTVQDIDIESTDARSARTGYQVTNKILITTTVCTEDPVIQCYEHRL